MQVKFFKLTSSILFSRKGILLKAKRLYVSMHTSLIAHVCGILYLYVLTLLLKKLYRCFNYFEFLNPSVTLHFNSSNIAFDVASFFSF